MSASIDEALEGTFSVAPPLAPAQLKPVPSRVPHGRPRHIGLAQRALQVASTICNEFAGPRERTAFGILMYHRVTDVIAGVAKPTWNVPPKQFEKQLAGLLRRGFQPWPLRKVLDYHRVLRPIPRPVFVVTLDDGFESVYRHAFPVLQKLRVPATIFLATAYLDSDEPFPSDDWSAAGSPKVDVSAWKPLTTDQCREMQASGLVELAAHTHTHEDFRGRPDDLVKDLHECQAILRERFDVRDATFSFPYGTKCDGFVGPDLAAAVRRAGLICALSTESLLVRRQDDPFDWGRFAAEDHDTAASLAAKLNGWHTALRGLGRAIVCKAASRGPQRRTYLPEPDSDTERL